MHILGVDYSQSGEVQCIAYDSSDPQKCESAFVDLVVLPVASYVDDLEFEPITNTGEDHLRSRAATLIDKPEDTIAQTGSTICLTARYAGWPTPTVKWFRAVSFDG